jgi:hypothetical protein
MFAFELLFVVCCLSFANFLFDFFLCVLDGVSCFVCSSKKRLISFPSWIDPSARFSLPDYYFEEGKITQSLSNPS